jgi:hypothetical protein
VVAACHAINVLHGDIKVRAPLLPVASGPAMRVWTRFWQQHRSSGLRYPSHQPDFSRPTARRCEILSPQPANFVLRHRQKNPLVSGDLQYLFTPWLAAIDLGCSQYLGPDVGRRAAWGGGLPRAVAGACCLLPAATEGRPHAGAGGAACGSCFPALWRARRRRVVRTAPAPHAPFVPSPTAAVHKAHRDAGIHGARDF